MVRLLQLELQKLLLNRTSKVLIFISFVLPLLVILLSAIKINFFGFFTLELGELGIYNFPIVWHLTTYFAANFKFFFAIVVVSMIGNEYSNKTIKQNLIDGLSKKEFILSKFYAIIFISLVSTIIIFIIGLILGFIYSSYTEIGIVLSETEFLLAYFIKLVGFFSLCLFLAVLAKRSAFALAFLFVEFILEWIIYLVVLWKTNDDIATKVQNFFPLKSMYKLIDQPGLRIAASKIPDKEEFLHDYAVHWYEIVIVLGWTALFVFLSYRLLKKRDL
ncbi:ABC transporter permease subunit [Flavobacteriaceae bacterium S0825]|uniref:ABC transporter permease subunit n=1 Tax=Gaetbulibacter sp. S0825 TaxID=2720084 RepID=UPI001431B75D|nr:ABC transporter permease subunit [Gaetbulibacter sp. S0825]MCK0108972.1 ABC transporter permease subunit [Flavobacteriaceae bacterium S0825]NIX64607.1 ABC transporter permease subunit [Gaetbulibacter sp. S0825]